jgi:hypothetical protein
VSNRPPESYFARKDNFVNVYFLKFGWLWTSLAFFAHTSQVTNVIGPFVRYVVATIWWYLVTQWCFGPPIMDKVCIARYELMKVFRGTGGICEIAKEEDFPMIVTSAVCRSSGGEWNGGHDLVCPRGFSPDNSEWSYFSYDACFIVYMVGDITVLFFT